MSKLSQLEVRIAEAEKVYEAAKQHLDKLRQQRFQLQTTPEDRANLKKLGEQCLAETAAFHRRNKRARFSE
jgi:hypothetical protein